MGQLQDEDQPASAGRALLQLAMSVRRVGPGPAPPSAGEHALRHLSWRGGGQALMQATRLTQSALASHACSWVQQVSSATVWQEDGKSGGKRVSPQVAPVVLPDPELLLDPDEPEPPLDPELPLEVSAAAAASFESDGVLLLEQPPESAAHAATSGTTSGTTT